MPAPKIAPFTGARDSEACNSLRSRVMQILGQRQLQSATGGLYAKYGKDWHSLKALGPASLLPDNKLLLWRAPFNPKETQMIMRLGITHVVNCANDECDSGMMWPPECRVLSLRARDSSDYDMLGEHLAEVERFMDQAYLNPNTNARVLIHCRCGQNRSTAIALAYLVHRRGMELPNVLESALRLRPVILTNEAFVEQLVQLAASCARDSSKIAETENTSCPEEPGASGARRISLPRLASTERARQK